eukprot:TRINITY_DN488_c0_g1_i19.p1 TRINITY_DN488_c0_g1~~TRINITY_DN488_c0_g1_i19.p1  ORF type:complete len:1248 (+),score=267.75 TRINITY_DN488_c0_g1_i19:208-3744(+)
MNTRPSTIPPELAKMLQTKAQEANSVIQVQTQPFTLQPDEYYRSRTFLLVGRSRAGKSTAVQVIKDPTVLSAPLSFYAQTREPFTEELYVAHRRDGVCDYYKLDMIDTPGLFEHAQGRDSARSDEEIQQMIVKYIRSKTKQLHGVFFVCSFNEGVTSDDTRAIAALLDTFRGTYYDGRIPSGFINLLVTRCEGKLPASRRRIEEQVKAVPEFKDLFTLDPDLKLFFLGALSDDHLTGADAVQKHLSNIIQLRTVLMQHIFRADKPCPVSEIAIVRKETEDHIARLVNELAAKNQALQNMTDQCKDAKQTLQDEIDAHNNTQNELQSSTVFLSSTEQSLRTEKTEHAEAKEQLQKTVNDLVAKSKAYENEVDAHKITRERLASTGEALKSTTADLASERELLRTEKVAHAEAKLQLQKTINDLVAKSKAYDSEVAAHQSTCKRRASTKEALKSTAAELASERELLRTEKAAHAEAKVQSQKIADDLVAKSEAYDSEVAAHQSTCKRRARTEEVLKSTAADLDLERELLRAEKVAHDKAKLQLQKIADDLVAKSEAYDSEVAAHQSTCKRRARTEEVLKSTAADLDLERELLRAEKVAHDKAKLQLQKIADDLVAKSKALEDEVAAHGSSQAILSSTKQTLQSERIDHSEAKNRLLKDIDELVANQHERKSEMTATNAYVLSLQRQQQIMTEQIAAQEQALMETTNKAAAEKTRLEEQLQATTEVLHTTSELYEATQKENNDFLHRLRKQQDRLAEEKDFRVRYEKALIPNAAAKLVPNNSVSEATNKALSNEVQRLQLQLAEMHRMTVNMRADIAAELTAKQRPENHKPNRSSQSAEQVPNVITSPSPHDQTPTPSDVDDVTKARHWVHEIASPPTSPANALSIGERIQYDEVSSASFSSQSAVQVPNVITSPSPHDQTPTPSDADDALKARHWVHEIASPPTSPANALSIGERIQYDEVSASSTSSSVGLSDKTVLVVCLRSEIGESLVTGVLQAKSVGEQLYHMKCGQDGDHHQKSVLIYLAHISNYLKVDDMWQHFCNAGVEAISSVVFTVQYVVSSPQDQWTAADDQVLVALSGLVESRMKITVVILVTSYFDAECKNAVQNVMRHLSERTKNMKLVVKAVNDPAAMQQLNKNDHRRLKGSETWKALRELLNQGEPVTVDNFRASAPNSIINKKK